MRMLFKGGAAFFKIEEIGFLQGILITSFHPLKNKMR